MFDVGACPGTPRVPSGHFNWSLATIDGFLYPAATSAIDADLDLDLYLDEGKGKGAAYTKANTTIGYPVASSNKVPGIEAECLMPETVESFGAYWWRHLGEAYPPIDPDQTSATEALFRTTSGQPAYGIVTGLLGLDAVHDLHTELHPIFAMAARVDTTLSQVGTTDEWVFFVRNWGTEGACSGHNHLWRSRQGGKYFITIPWRDGASAVAIVRPHDPNGEPSELDEARESEVFTNCDTPVRVEFAYKATRGVVVEVALPKAEEACSADGQLFLRWNGSAPGESGQTIYALNRRKPVEEEFKLQRSALVAERNVSYRGVATRGPPTEITIGRATRVKSLWRWATGSH